MAETWVRVRGRDPLLFRDGRPFGSEPGALAARTLRLPAPGTLAGFLRTCVGNSSGWDWQNDGPRRAQGLEVAGPVLTLDETPLFPAPADAVVYKAEGEQDPLRVMPLRPFRPPAGAGSNVPGGALPARVTQDEKPADDYRYWPGDRLRAWLGSALGSGFPPPEPVPGPEIEERTHVAISPATGTSAEGQLFTTEGLACGRVDRPAEGFRYQEWSMLARLRGEPARVPGGLAPFGGEGRLASLETVPAPAWRACPPELAAQLRDAAGVRMLLATPAVFAGGWKPGWLDTDLVGAPPPAPETRLRLVAAAVPRRTAVSGWDYARAQPKAVRWLVPAGSVYFFEIVEGDPSALASSAWLEPVSDAGQDCSDGYGLALWGVWSAGEE